MTRATIAMLCAMIALSACVNSQSNLDRLKVECALAPLASIGNSFIPVPGVGGVLNLTIGEVCANPQLIANDEAKIAAAIQALTQKPQ